MNLYSLPDLAAMVILMGVLEMLRRKHRASSIGIWMLGLTFILIETSTAAVLRGAPRYNDLGYALALDAYILAGVTFGWAARQDLLPNPLGLPLFVPFAIPLFALATLFAVKLGSDSAYLWITAATFVLGFVYLLLLGHSDARAGDRPTWRFRSATLLIHFVAWAPMTWMAFHAAHRLLIYWGLGCLYLLVAVSFRRRVHRNDVGGLIIVVGFVIWALCFLVHPFVRDMPAWDGVRDQIWNMQKFFVIIGMLLVLLEDQTRLLSEEALQDPLTGLPNRRLFDDRLLQALSRVSRTGLSAAVFVVDLDNFKHINDNFGHRTGDLVLVQAAQMLKANIRSSDTLARCGGDEFNVIINDLSRAEDCERIAEALRGALASVDIPGDRSLPLSGSIGYALFPNDVSDPAELCELADVRMYKEKRAKTYPAPARR